MKKLFPLQNNENWIKLQLRRA